MKKYLILKSKIPAYLKYWFYKTRIENLVFNKTYSETQEGISLILNNTIEEKMILGFKASESTQNTTRGYQLFNINNLISIPSGVSVTDDDYIVVNITNTGSSVRYIDLPTTNLNLQTSTNYLLITEIESIVNCDLLSCTQWGQLTNAIQKSSSGKFINTITTKSSFSNNIGINTSVAISANKTGQIKFRLSVFPVIDITTDNFVYEKFTGEQPSPSPEYSQDIHVVKGDNEVFIENKNLFNKNSITENYYYNSNLEYIPSANTALSDYIEVTSDSTYILSYTKNTNDITNIRINYFNSSKMIQQQVIDSKSTTGRKSYTLTVPTDIQYIRFSYSTLDNYIEQNTIQLEKGSQATPYMEHKEQNYSLSLGDLEMCKIGNYADEIFKNVPECEYYDSTLEYGKWYKLSNIGKLVLNGSENWDSLVAYGHNGYNLSVDDILLSNNNSNPSLLLSDYFKGYNILELFQNNISSYGIARRTNSFQIIIRNDLVNSLAEFKEWLENNNVTIYYPLKTPTKTLLSNTLQTELDNIYENAHSYNSVTNITQINEDRPFIISATYFRKVKGDNI